MTEREREREKDIQRETDIHTHVSFIGVVIIAVLGVMTEGQRQTHTETERQTDRQTDRQRDRDRQLSVVFFFNPSLFHLSAL